MHPDGYLGVVSRRMPVANRSKGAVTVVSTSGATKVVYVDASGKETDASTLKLDQ
jgi:hypothetical protein